MPGSMGVHEVCEAAFGCWPALTGFSMAASAIRPGPVAWIAQGRVTREHGHLMQAGLPDLRAKPPAILSICTNKLSDTLWATEESVRSGAVSLVVAELEAIDFTASRRLALASGRHNVPVILLMPYTCAGATAASARWRVSARPSAPNRFDPRAPGFPRWRAVLERARQAPHMTGKVFDIELNNETLSLSMVSGMATDPAHAGPARAALPHGHRQRA
ncbi:ImuA family protein [Hyphomonas johnsonii]|uniref:Protein ImuA n=1 Tax=Hyphomonas johnsonii MHS-2 TaxID=1280950 RepID=A0A059FSL8_9PROT|nr:hypothetical protein [Hyphomonas johnsonii]KCZ93496.1 hypothetical protein HJO_06565 [Hyphomonas johnsonii MHS-2]